MNKDYSLTIWQEIASDLKYDLVKKILSNYQNATDKLQEMTDNSQEFSFQDTIGLRKKISNLQPLFTLMSEIFNIYQQICTLEETENKEDEDYLAMVMEEIQELKARGIAVKNKILEMLNSNDNPDSKAIIEIRAATGGDEAALFAHDLLKMYQRYAELKDWNCEILQADISEIGGLKDAVIGIEGNNCFELLQYESGVHRVQRVPATESQGRVHTSTATVAVLYEDEGNQDYEIADTDIRIDCFRAQGAGGQHVNKTDSAVRITHLPTGLVVVQQDDKSQHRNKAKAMRILRARLIEREQEKQHAQRDSVRKSQIGSGQRSEKIRTYNFAQNRITDHRVKITLYKLDKVLLGDGLDELINVTIQAINSGDFGQDDG